jgi:hypothetical protein
MPFKVTNNGKDTRKFRDVFLGKDVHVLPSQSVEVISKPDVAGMFSVDKLEESKKLKKQED